MTIVPDPHAYDVLLDATGLRCPLPLLRAKKQLGSLDKGARLLVKCTDPTALDDFQAFAKMTPHALLQAWQEQDTHFILMQK